MFVIEESSFTFAENTEESKTKGHITLIMHPLQQFIIYYLVPILSKQCSICAPNLEYTHSCIPHT